MTYSFCSASLREMSTIFCSSRNMLLLSFIFPSKVIMILRYFFLRNDQDGHSDM